MAGEPSIALLRPDDAEAWAQLRWEALVATPLLFGSAAPDGPEPLVELFQRRLLPPEALLFGAFDAGRLVGACGVLREMSPAARRRGLGRALLDAAVGRARAWPGVEQVHLAVSEAPDNAKALYVRAGFVAWGREPRALVWQGQSADETHLVLDLRP